MGAKRLYRNGSMSSDHFETYQYARKRAVSVPVRPDHLLDVQVGTPRELVPSMAIPCIAQVMDRLAEVSEII